MATDRMMEEWQAWRYLCERLQAMGCVSKRVMESPVGRIPADFTARESDEADLMDAIRAWGNRLVVLRGGKLP